MRIIKHVPTEPGLTAAHAAYEAHGADAFRDFAEGQMLFDDAGIEVDDLVALLPDIPDTEMGRAWKAAMTEALALTEADSYRGYDKFLFEDFENAVAGAITELADTVEASSPLLREVATVIRRQAQWYTMCDLDGLAEKRAEVTVEGISLRDAVDDEVVDLVVPWEHIEPMVPDLHQRLTSLLDALRLDAPSYVDEDDPGSSRIPAAYALT